MEVRPYRGIPLTYESSSGLSEFFKGIAIFVNKTVDVYRTGVVELVSSVSDASELKSCATFLILC